MTKTTTPRRTARDNDAALAEFIAKKAEIDAMLARLQALSDDHFNVHPDDVHWGHVANLGRYEALLREISDIAFEEGEYAN